MIKSTNITLRSKIVSIIVMLIYAMVSLFPFTALGLSEFSFKNMGIDSIVFLLYLTISGLLIILGKKSGWLMLLSSITYRLITVFISFIMGSLSLIYVEFSGAMILYGLGNLLVYFILAAILYSKKNRSDFCFYEKTDSTLTITKDIRMLQMLNIFIIISVFLNSLATGGGLFIVIDAIPHLICCFFVFIGLKKNYTYSWYILLLIILERLYLSMTIIITATEHALYFYSFVLQLIICLTTFYFLLEKNILSGFRVIKNNDVSE